MPHKLLLADDSVTIQRVIELTFADEDVQVIAVGDGQKAIERIEAERPDIVLADVGMPERDGYEVAAFVKNTAHLAHIPVLLLTGAFEPVDEQRASAVGCDGVLAKPFEPHMVITRVKELLAGVRVRGGAERPRRRRRVPAPAVAEEGGGAAKASQTEALAAGEAPAPAARLEAEPERGGAQSAGGRRASPDQPPHTHRRTGIRRTGSAGGIARGARRVLRPPSTPPSRRCSRPRGTAADSGQVALLPEPPSPAGAPAEPAPELALAKAATAAARESLVEPSLADPAPAPVAKAQAPALGIAQAFSALFAAERGETAPDAPAIIGRRPCRRKSIDDLAERGHPAGSRAPQRPRCPAINGHRHRLPSRGAARAGRNRARQSHPQVALLSRPACLGMACALAAPPPVRYAVGSTIEGNHVRPAESLRSPGRGRPLDSFWASIGAFKAQPESAKPVFSMVLRRRTSPVRCTWATP